MSNHHLLLVDASGFAHMAFHSQAHRYRSDGLPTWATLGFLGMVYGLLDRAEADPPTHAAAVFDAPGKTFRHKLFKAYKANRPDARRLELDPQMPFMRHAAQALGLEPVEREGFEADDVIATLAVWARFHGVRVTIVSRDKDFCQLVEDGKIEIVDPVARKRILEAQVKAKFGVRPDQVVDVQALCGDAVDNIPGIDGIGVQMAGKLIRQYGTLDALLKAAGESGRAIGSPTIKRRLREQAKEARLYRKLASLDTSVILPVATQGLDWLKRQPIERDHLKEMLRLLEAGDRYEIMFGGEPGVTMRAKHVPAPLQWWHGQPKGEGMVTVEASDVPLEPQDGYFKRRLVRKGPWVAGRIWRTPETDFVTEKETGFDVIHCEVDGKPRHPLRHWDALGQFPITKTEFNRLMKVADSAKTNEPTAPQANPSEPINLQSVKSIPNPRLKGKVANV